MSEEKRPLTEVLDQLAEMYKEVESSWEKDANEYWASLDQEHQMLAFFSVMKRVYQGEIVEGRSYRGVLYDIFGFGPEAYAMGMFCGFLQRRCLCR